MKGKGFRKRKKRNVGFLFDFFEVLVKAGGEFVWSFFLKLGAFVGFFSFWFGRSPYHFLLGQQAGVFAWILVVHVHCRTEVFLKKDIKYGIVA